MNWLKRYRYAGAAFFLSSLLSACTAAPISPANMPSMLEPQGPAAARLAELWWLMFGLGALIFLLVVALMFAALSRGRRAGADSAADSRGGDEGRKWVIRGGILLPMIVIAVTFGYSIYTLAVVENAPGDPAVHINVTGRRWWWEVNYPVEGITTANEIHIPVGKPVQINLESADVIHSFWVPELHGKMDLVPTRLNSIIIQADQPGVYRGQCAEFCGLQHAHMGFLVIAESNEAYEEWKSAQVQPAQSPADELAADGQDVFVSQGCVFCHTVRGLEDKPVDRSAIDLGPDLTHLASRQTIAGASLTANTGNLAGWVSDAQHVKPGALMPNTYINAQDLQALLAYLMSLR
ncbi:MAG TPA: cytochrome c oxidase subunit II [Anaerolineaceae bacterium]